MFTLKVTQSFSAAHNLRHYKGKCEKLHGHNWKVEVEVKGKSLSASGMLVDFHTLKEALEKVLTKFDHSYLNGIPPFNKVNPTSENIAKYIYITLNSKFLPCRQAGKIQNSKLFKVTIWESETSSASYQEDN